MELLQSIQKLPKNEKLLIMEYLWENLSEDNNEFESPEWHRNALAETEKRLENGEENIIDWTEAKRQLRKTFE
ncbi:MAG: addiction module protein [Desulfococcaceae bacterium]|jgi:predicted kinase|nr:addiction module protein [Desulfococcaceae bacterium]